MSGSAERAKPSLGRWAAWVLLALAGACAGAAGGRALGHAWSYATPAGWTRVRSTVPFKRGDLVGNLPADGATWALDHGEALLTRGPASGSVEIRLELPEHGRLTVVPRTLAAPHGKQRSAGYGFRIERGRPVTAGLHLRPDSESPLPCEGELPPAAEAPYPLAVTLREDGFVASSGGGTLTCRVPATTGPFGVQSGLRRVRVGGGALGRPLPLSPVLPLAILGGALALGLASIERRLGAQRHAVIATSLPLLAAFPALLVDGAELAERLRVPSVPPEGLALAVALVPTGLAKAFHHALRLSRGQAPASGRTLGATGLLVGMGLALARVAGAEDATAWAGFAGAGAVCGALAWVSANAGRVRALPAVAWGLLGLALASSEAGIRHTSTGRAWGTGGAWWVPRDQEPAESEFAALRQGQHPVYPARGYPVAWPPRGELPRIACFGGSSTGGAFQNDDLREFYPARLDEALQGRAEVLNQGVGGWNSFHIRRYMDARLVEMRPDVVTLYVGHNDVFARSPRPYRELYARWEAGGAGLRLAALLERSRLYAGFRSLVLAAARSGRGVAVPIEDARDNLEGIVARARAVGARVLLTSEATDPDPAALAPYRTMLAEVAEGSGGTAAWVDAGAALEARGPAMFLDDCHLSDAGHRALAELLAAELGKLGWTR